MASEGQGKPCKKEAVLHEEEPYHLYERLFLVIMMNSP